MQKAFKKTKFEGGFLRIQIHVSKPKSNTCLLWGFPEPIQDPEPPGWMTPGIYGKLFGVEAGQGTGVAPTPTSFWRVPK